jgi:hypothetical protein
MSLGLFLHCHYFWGKYHLSVVSVLGKILSAVAFIAALAFLLVRVGVFGLS